MAPVTGSIAALGMSWNVPAGPPSTWLGLVQVTPESSDLTMKTLDGSPAVASAATT